VVAGLPAYRKRWRTLPHPQVRRWLLAPLAAGPRPGPWPVPDLPDVGALAAWLGLTMADLEWIADARSLERRTGAERLRHYASTPVPTSSGGVRLLERPKPRLKAAQRRVLRGLLAGLPVHPAAHGFVSGRSVRTYAVPHAGREVVVHLDLEGFFPSVNAGRVYGTLRVLTGLPEPVAHLLTGLCTTVVPLAVWRAVPLPARTPALAAHGQLGRALAVPHLPQGAPTSPALANLVAHALDRRLTGLAAAFGASYTRYGDDLAFSGGRGLRDGAPGLLRAVDAVVRDCGFRLAGGKTTVRPRSRRQLLAGAVVNERVTLGRAETDRLRAILYNCAANGPDGQNRDGVPDFRGYLLGRIGWVGGLDPAKGARLRAAFDRIEWPDGASGGPVQEVVDAGDLGGELAGVAGTDVRLEDEGDPG